MGIDAVRAAAEEALHQLLPRFGVPLERRVVATPLGHAHYLVAGAGPCVVLLHAGFGGAGNWYRTLGPLSRHFRVLAPDRPGYGLSDGTPAADPMHWLPALAAAEGPLAALVGHVAGGAVALRYVAARPDEVRALVLGDLELAAPGFTPPPDLRPAVVPDSLARWHRGVAARFADRRLLAPEYLYYLWCLQQLRPEQAQWPPGDAAPGPVPLPGAGERTWPARPLLLIWGRGNRWTPPGIARDLHARIPDARLVVIEHSKGMPQLEQPGEYNYAVINFLRRALAAAS